MASGCRLPRRAWSEPSRPRRCVRCIATARRGTFTGPRSRWRRQRCSRNTESSSPDLSLENAVRVPALLLRRIHRRVGTIHQDPLGVAVIRVYGDADTRADATLLTEQHDGTNRGPEYTRSKDLDIVQAARVLAEQHELIAAEARHQVARARAGAQAGRRLPQERVAGLMAEGVVDLFEMVQVEEQDREATLPCTGIGDRRRQGLIECRPIGQLRETVVRGEVTNALIRPLALGDVTPDADDADDVAGIVTERNLARGE